jgi:hypothetical protein
VPRGGLGERAGVEHLRHPAFATSRVVAIRESPERKKRDVFGQGHSEREPSLSDRQSPSRFVVREAEHSAVDRMKRKAQRSPAPFLRERLAENRDVRVVVAEEPNVERLEDAPGHGCERTGGCGTQARMHTL